MNWYMDVRTIKNIGFFAVCRKDCRRGTPGGARHKTHFHHHRWAV